MPGPRKSYELGYCKPPSEHRFRKGQSGNPRGRQKGARSLQADLEAELGAEIEVTENGKRRAVTKQQALLRCMMNDALRGDHKAAAKLLDLVVRAGGSGESATRPLAALLLEDAEVLADLMRRRAGEEGRDD